MGGYRRSVGLVLRGNSTLPLQTREGKTRWWVPRAVVRRKQELSEGGDRLKAFGGEDVV
ncbi:hypothetical protein IMZ48_25320 [Candidatus Bathyarchaeota archaeon]|nr:hypothetical protein [Candidatus Bathyarchaeota archaeon]